MKFNIALITFFLSYTIALSQPYVIEIEGWIYTNTIDSSEMNKRRIDQKELIPFSPMASRIAKKVGLDICNYNNFISLISSDGYDDKMYWTIIKFEGALKVHLQTNSVWLGNLVHSYLNEFSKSNYLNWHDLVKHHYINIPPKIDNPNDVTRRISVGSGYSLLSQPSTKLALPSYLFSDVNTIGDVNSILSEALNRCNYADRGYFEYEDGGFEIITRIQEIHKDGSFKRWLTNDYKKNISILEYFKLLLFENRGLYRMVVIKYQPKTENLLEGTGLSAKKAEKIFNQSDPKISQEHHQKEFIKTQHYDSNVFVYIYEFESSEYSNEIKLLNHGSLTAQEHIKVISLWENLHYVTNKRP